MEEDDGAVRSTANGSASEDWANPTFSLMSLSNVAHFIVLLFDPRNFHPTTTSPDQTLTRSRETLPNPDPSRRSESKRKNQPKKQKQSLKWGIRIKERRRRTQTYKPKKTLFLDQIELIQCAQLGFRCKKKDLRSKFFKSWISLTPTLPKTSKISFFFFFFHEN